jgi:hypothetical protein
VKEAEQTPAAPTELWLGYDGLLVPLASITAVLAYQPAWDRRIIHAYGSVPPDVRAVVLLDDGRALPARRALNDLHARWTEWQATRS